MPASSRSHRPSAAALLVAAALAAAVCAPTETARAQAARWAAGLQAGSGLSLAGGQGGTGTAMSPVFLEASVRHWTDEQPDVRYGGALRVEMLGVVSAGGVARVELFRDLGGISLSPGIGFPFVLVPGTLFGAEVSLQTRLPLGDFGITLLVYADVYLFGTDLPSNTAVVMLNGAIGVDLSL